MPVSDALTDFATRYTAAWCSQDPSRVAAFFAENGSLQINDGSPSVGRAAISEAARSFMTAFPDMIVAMDALESRDGHTYYRWTLTGTHTSGPFVRISGYEDWTLDPSTGLIARSLGHYDDQEFQRQLSS